MKKLILILFCLASINLFGQVGAWGEGGSGQTSAQVAAQIHDSLSAFTASSSDSAVYADSAGLVRNYTPAGGTIILSGDDSVTFTTGNTTTLTLPTSGTLATTANINDSLTARLNSALDISDLAPLLVDTVVFYTFGLGSGAAGDTAAFTNGNLCGAFYNESSDTLVITSQWAVIQTGTGTSTIGVSVQWDDTLNAVVPTKLNTSDVTITSVNVGSEDTSFNNAKIPPKEWVWGEISGVSAGNKPKFLQFQISGYRIHTY